MRTKVPHSRTGELATVVRDPVQFCAGLLQHDIWAAQARILEAVATHRRTAVKACHASGKTFVAAAAVLWFVTRYPDAIVVTTAPTWTQVQKLLWGEIHKAVQRSRVAYPPLNKTELTLGPGNYAIGLSTNEGVRFQGFHGRVLVIVDEAPGVRRDIWDAIEGIRAGGDVRVLALGNPTVASGPFHDAFTANRESWTSFTISAFDTPNLRGLTLETLLALPDDELDRVERPYLVTRRWVREKYHEWGPTHPLWAARVLGEFPMQAEDALIALSWLEGARTAGGDAGGSIAAGIDVAGPGEHETVLALTEGPNVLALHAWSDPDPRGDVVAVLEQHRDRLSVVSVDSVGIGYHLATHLEDLGFPVREVNAGETARQPDRFRNLKAEYSWDLRLRFQAAAVAGLTDERTIGQLAGIRYRHTSAGQIEIERKDEANRRGVKSPDRAEALMLAFAGSPFVQPRRWTSSLVEERPLHPYDEQLREELPFLDRATEQLTCRDCANLAPGDGAFHPCTFRRMQVRPGDLACEAFLGRF